MSMASSLSKISIKRYVSIRFPVDYFVVPLFVTAVLSVRIHRNVGDIVWIRRKTFYRL